MLSHMARRGVGKVRYNGSVTAIPKHDLLTGDLSRTPSEECVYHFFRRRIAT
jgi:hypothetical protein